MVATLSLVAAATVLSAFGSAAEDDAETRAMPEGPLWNAVGVSSARSAFARDAKALRVTLASGDRASFTRQIGVSSGAAFRCVFDLSVEGVPAGARATQVFRLGSGFDASTADAAEASTFARLSLDATAAGFRLNDPVAGGEGRRFSGTQAVTWALNDAGRVLTYAAPDGATQTLGAGRMDVWVGRTRVIADAPVSAGRTISDLKWYWATGSGTTRMDHLAVLPLQDDAGTVPVPAEAAPGGLVAPPGNAEAPLELYRPSPNPFESTTRFAYEVSAGPQPVDIGVFDLSGRRVRTLAHGAQTIGRYEVVWDGRGNDGAPSRHGFYFLRASVGSTSRVARVVYLFQ